MRDRREREGEVEREGGREGGEGGRERDGWMDGKSEKIKCNCANLIKNTITSIRTTIIPATATITTSMPAIIPAGDITGAAGTALLGVVDMATDVVVGGGEAVDEGGMVGGSTGGVVEGTGIGVIEGVSDGAVEGITVVESETVDEVTSGACVEIEDIVEEGSNMLVESPPLPSSEAVVVTILVLLGDSIVEVDITVGAAAVFVEFNVFVGTGVLDVFVGTGVLDTVELDVMFDPDPDPSSIVAVEF